MKNGMFRTYYETSRMQPAEVLRQEETEARKE